MAIGPIIRKSYNLMEPSGSPCVQDISIPPQLLECEYVVSALGHVSVLFGVRLSGKKKGF